MSDVTEAMTIAGAATLRAHWPHNSAEYTANRIYTAMREASPVQEGDLVEQIARAICVANHDDDPDEMAHESDLRVWELYLPDAKAALAIVQERMERMERALERHSNFAMMMLRSLLVGIEMNKGVSGWDESASKQAEKVFVEALASDREALASPIKDEVR
jgi:hypothetical protein